MVAIGSKVKKETRVFEVFQIDRTNGVVHAVIADFVFWSFPDDENTITTVD